MIPFEVQPTPILGRGPVVRAPQPVHAVPAGDEITLLTRSVGEGMVVAASLTLRVSVP